MIPDDDDLLDLLGEALRRAEPVSDRARQAAITSFSWRTVDAELAALVYDSGMELVSGARSDEVARQLTFEGAGVEIEVMIVPVAERRLVGQLVPPRVATVTLTSENHVQQATSDELGHFRFEAVGSGPTRLSVASEPDQPPLHTQWVVL